VLGICAGVLDFGAPKGDLSFLAAAPRLQHRLLAVAESRLCFPATSIQCTHTNVPLNLLRSGYTRSGKQTLEVVLVCPLSQTDDARVPSLRLFNDI
jgi:hypothetical protein